MRKSIVVLAAALVAVSVAHISGAEARGLRIGLGFGVPFGPGARHADPTILERLDRQRYKTVRTHEAVSFERRQTAIAAAKARAQQQAADRQAAARHAAAKEAAAREGQRQAREAASARKQVLAAKAARPVAMIAPVAQVAPIAAVIPAEERSLEVAQEQQREKAEQLLKSLSSPSQQAAPTYPVQPRLVVAPAVEREPASAPVVTQIAAPKATAPAKAVVGGDCKRFIAGAGVTISVPCSE